MILKQHDCIDLKLDQTNIKRKLYFCRTPQSTYTRNFVGSMPCAHLLGGSIVYQYIAKSHCPVLSAFPLPSDPTTPTPVAPHCGSRTSETVDHAFRDRSTNSCSLAFVVEKRRFCTPTNPEPGCWPLFKNSERRGRLTGKKPFTNHNRDRVLQVFAILSKVYCK